MKLIDSVCNVELAKKLEKLGVKQDSQWYWWYDDPCSDPNDPAYGVYGDWLLSCNKLNRSLSAFTVAELGEMLPSNKIRTLKWFNDWFCEAFNDVATQSNPLCRLVGKTEAKARAKMVIYLKERKLI